MLKYVDAIVSFSEVPDEITLAINISNCPCGCKGCHSQYLAGDIGTVLNWDSLNNLIKDNEGISCVCLMGGDNDTFSVDTLAETVKYNYSGLKTAWYSGRQELSKEIDLNNFDYIKLGPYEEDKGPLSNPNTNQRFFKINHSNTGEWDELIDITYKFWKNETENKGEIIRRTTT